MFWVNISKVYMTKLRAMQTANKFLRPYLSPKLGSQRSVLAHPTKRAEPRSPTFQLGAHIKSSLSYQLSRDFSEVISTDQLVMRLSLSQMFYALQRLSYSEWLTPAVNSQLYSGC